jgi:hypothetical protein
MSDQTRNPLSLADNNLLAVGSMQEQDFIGAGPEEVNHLAQPGEVSKRPGTTGHKTSAYRINNQNKVKSQMMVMSTPGQILTTDSHGDSGFNSRSRER